MITPLYVSMACASNMHTPNLVSAWTCANAQSSHAGKKCYAVCCAQFCCLLIHNDVLQALLLHSRYIIDTLHQLKQVLLHIDIE